MNRSLIHLIIATVLLIVGIGVFVFAYLTVNSAGAKVSAIDAKILETTEQTERIMEAEDALAALAESERRIQSYFVSTDEVVPFLEAISATGETFGSEVQVVGVTDETNAEGRNRIALSLSVSGSFNAVMRTIGALEYAPYDIILTNLSLDASSLSDDGNTWTASASYSVGTTLANTTP